MNLIIQNLRLLYSLNPMVGVIEGFRWCIIPNSEIYIPALIISIILAIVGLALGVKFLISLKIHLQI